MNTVGLFILYSVSLLSVSLVEDGRHCHLDSRRHQRYEDRALSGAVPVVSTDQ